MKKFLTALREKLFGKKKEVKSTEIAHNEPVKLHETKTCVCGKEKCQNDDCKCGDNCSCKKVKKSPVKKAPSVKTKIKVTAKRKKKE
jgi:hypothetical protein